LYVPVVQPVHTALSVAATTELNWPAMHAVHAVVPVVRLLYTPTTQSMHGIRPWLQPYVHTGFVAGDTPDDCSAAPVPAGPSYSVTVDAVRK